MKTVVLYETAPETTMEKMMEVFPAHQENEDKFVKAGKILGIGPFAIRRWSNGDFHRQRICRRICKR
jgi:uncharacterized protein YciI